MELSELERGPEAFERLLSTRLLTDREADAVRSAALGMTAFEAAKVMGVGASTVGSYRLRAYRKLGVQTISEFRAIPEVRAWRDALRGGRDLSSSHDGEEVARDVATSAGDLEVVAEPFRGVPSPGRTLFSEARAKLFPGSPFVMVPRALLGLMLAIIVVIVVAPVVFHAASDLFIQSRYVKQPTSTIDVEGGVLPDVVGMRADEAARLLAESRYCPEFVATAEGGVPGQVVAVDVREVAPRDGEAHDEMSWRGGYTATYNVKGDWDGYVILSVAM